MSPVRVSMPLCTGHRTRQRWRQMRGLCAEVTLRSAYFGGANGKRSIIICIEALIISMRFSII
ncbi:MAG: hypothetical protein JWP47_882 [Polaromonas sp.]|nr:hypothetical protein [Polaromonas sp.]